MKAILDRAILMDNSPVLSKIYNEIKKEESAEESYWLQYISRTSKYGVRMMKEPDFNELSEDEIEVLSEIYAQFRHMNRCDLGNYCHKNLPEWEDPMGSSYPIPFEKILKLFGNSEEEISVLEEEINAYEYARDLVSVE